MHNVTGLLGQMSYTFNSHPANGTGGVGSILFLLIFLAIMVLAIAGLWKTFVKAGWPGWVAIIPFVNLYALVKIAGRPGWWLVLFFIPLVNLIVLVVINLDIAARFGRSALFGIGLMLLGPIFYFILGFGESQYRPLASTAQGFTPIFPNQP